MKTFVKLYPTIASTVALVIALTGVGAWAAGKITSKEIQNRTIRRVDIHSGAVTPRQANFPTPHQIGAGAGAAAGTRAAVGATYALVANMGSYTKLDSSTVLQVTWTGPVEQQLCAYQLRVDGSAPPGGGGEFFASSAPTSASVQALFPGLNSGQHDIQIYARVPSGYGQTTCSVGPAGSGMQETVNVAELVQ